MMPLLQCNQVYTDSLVQYQTCDSLQINWLVLEITIIIKSKEAVSGINQILVFYYTHETVLHFHFMRFLFSLKSRKITT